MRKTILAVAAITICAALVGFGSLAYFTASDRASNTISTGSIDIELIETDAEGAPFIDPERVMPGDVIDKVVTIRNNGSSAAWIRCKVDIDCGELSSEHIQLDINTEHWTYSDGYYYYTQPVEPGAVTSPLFTCVTLSADMGNEFQNASFSVNISANAVQTANNGQTVFDAVGWPAD